MMRLPRTGRTVLAITGTAAAVLLAGCSGASQPAGGSSAAGASSGLVNVVASTNVYGNIAAQIGGDFVHVTSIISDPSQDPHSYEANTRNQLELSKADIVIENGGGYDDFMTTMLQASKSAGATVLNAVQISGKVAPAGGSLNEHVWYDLPSMVTLTDHLVSALSAHDPAHAATFQTNGQRFAQSLAPLIATEQQLKAGHTGTGIAVTEPVPLYMLQACGLVDKTPPAFSRAIEEGNDVSPLALQQALDLVTSKQIALLAYNEQTTSPETQRLLSAAHSAGIPVVPVTETLPSGKTYQTWMAANLAAIKAALA